MTFRFRSYIIWRSHFNHHNRNLNIVSVDSYIFTVRYPLIWIIRALRYSHSMKEVHRRFFSKANRFRSHSRHHRLLSWLCFLLRTRNFFFGQSANCDLRLVRRQKINIMKIQDHEQGNNICLRCQWQRCWYDYGLQYRY